MKEKPAYNRTLPDDTAVVPKIGYDSSSLQESTISISGNDYITQEKLNKYLSNLLKGEREKREELEDKFKKNIENETKKLKISIKKVSDNGNDIQVKIIETLGIFVALFTFVSVEFQMFKSFTSWKAGASLTLILLGALTFFVLLLDSFLRERKKIFYITFLIPLIFVFFGIYFFNFTIITDSDYVLINDDIKQTINQSKMNVRILDCLRNVGYIKRTCFDVIN